MLNTELNYLSLNSNNSSPYVWGGIRDFLFVLQKYLLKYFLIIQRLQNHQLPELHHSHPVFLHMSVLLQAL